MQKFSSRGFTYLEMIVVLMIIIASTALLTPKFFSAFDERELSQEAELLLGDCYLARSLSIAHDENMILVLDNHHGYKIIRQNGEIMKLIAFDETSISGQQFSRVIFFKNGTTIGNTFCLKKGALKRYVTVAQSGRTRVSEVLE